MGSAIAVSTRRVILVMIGFYLHSFMPICSSGQVRVGLFLAARQ